MLSGEIRLWTLAPRVRLFWGRVLGHVVQKHQSHFPRSSSFDDFDQRPPRQSSNERPILQEFLFIFGNCGRLLFLKFPVSHSPLVPNPFQIIKIGLSMKPVYSLQKNSFDRIYNCLSGLSHRPSVGRQQWRLTKTSAEIRSRKRLIWNSRRPI